MAPTKQKNRCIVLLIDGLSTKKLNSFLRKGMVPNIKKLINKGTFIKTCVSTFPSVTGPAHIPIFTGKNPFHFGISGHNQFNRNYRYFDEYLLYYKPLNKKLAGSKTVYDYYENSVAIGELIYKGSKRFYRYFTNLLVWFFRNDLDTTRVFRRIIKEYINGRDLIVGWVPNSDSFQHISKNEGKMNKLIKKTDEFIGKLMNIKGENTRIIICSDHGMEKAKKRFRLKKAFKEIGMRISKMKFNFDGGGFAQIYFKHPNKGTFWKHKMPYKRFKDYILKETNFEDMMKRLSKAKAIEFLIAAKKHTTYIFSKKGVATISKKNGKYLYTVLEGNDPFEYSQDQTAKKLINQWISKKECLEYSHHTNYPDAIYQSHGLLQLRNSGELIITASKGITWNAIEPHAVHGGLRRDQMVTPLIISDKISHPKKFARTEETFNYIIHKN